MLDFLIDLKILSLVLGTCDINQLHMYFVDPFQLRVTFYIETSHLISRANQKNRFLHEMQHWAEMG